MRHAAVSPRRAASAARSRRLGLRVGPIEERDLEFRDLGEEGGQARLARGRERRAVSVDLCAQPGDEGLELGERVERDPFGQVEALGRLVLVGRGPGQVDPFGG